MRDPGRADVGLLSEFRAEDRMYPERPGVGIGIQRQTLELTLAGRYSLF
jgi:hypothetical protein